MTPSKKTEVQHNYDILVSMDLVLSTALSNYNHQWAWWPSNIPHQDQRHLQEISSHQLYCTLTAKPGSTRINADLPCFLLLGRGFMVVGAN